MSVAQEIALFLLSALCACVQPLPMVPEPLKDEEYESVPFSRRAGSVIMRTLVFGVEDSEHDPDNDILYNLPESKHAGGRKSARVQVGRESNAALRGVCAAAVLKGVVGVCC